MILCQRFNQYTAITRIVEMWGNLTYHNYALQAKRAYVVNLSEKLIKHDYFIKHD